MEKNDEMFEDNAQAVEERLKELEKQKMTLPNEEEVSLKEVSNAVADKITEKPRPRDRNPHETDEDYVAYLKEYYENLPMNKDENKDILSEHLDEKYPGTSFYKPRYRDPNETDEEYEQFLEEYTKRVMEKENKKQEESDHLNEKYPGTPFYKPRYRKPHETAEEYEQFLKEYYDKTIDRKLNEKMAGREVYKPRDRRPYETDKEYENFLKKYYEENVTPIPKMAFKKDNKHKVVSTKENLKHKLMRKFLIIATWTTIGLSALFNIKNITDKTHKVDTNKDNNKRIEHIDENQTPENEKDIEKIAQDEIDKMLSPAEIKIGDKIKLKEGTRFYYDSTKAKPVGHIGNKYAPASDKYIITGEAIVDKSTNSVVATNYDKDESLEDSFLDGKDKSQYRRMILISSKDSHGKAGTENDYGWINVKNHNITVVQSHNTEKGGRGK